MPLFTVIYNNWLKIVTFGLPKVSLLLKSYLKFLFLTPVMRGEPLSQLTVSVGVLSLFYIFHGFVEGVQIQMQVLHFLLG